MQGTKSVFGVLLLVKDLEIFDYHFLDGFRSKLLSFFIRGYGWLLRVKEFGYEWG